MGLSGNYNNPVPDEEGIAVIKEAFSKGITFFDTSNLYGVNYANEYLVGKVISQIPYIMAAHYLLPSYFFPF